MDRIISIIVMLLSLTQNISCQNMKEENLPKFQVEICAPENKYRVEFVKDSIKKLEGVPAGLPYGGTSGEWGNSGSGWTEQYGTPIGADITYYSKYEDMFYRLNVDFPLDKIKDYMERAYADGEIEEKFHSEPLQKYKRLGRNQEFGLATNPYSSFSDLVFGFAPKGMVVVWLRFGSLNQIELGRYQAAAIKDDKKEESIMFSKTITVSRYEIRKERYIENASPLKWDNYRIKYKWKPVISSENKGLRLFNMNIKFFNGELENMLRPWINNIPSYERAIPKELNFTWETGKNQQYIGRAYFNWEKANEIFKNAGDQFIMELKIAPDNNNFEILINNQTLPIDIIRIFQTDELFNDSYK